MVASSLALSGLPTPTQADPAKRSHHSPGAVLITSPPASRNWTASGQARCCSGAALPSHPGASRHPPRFARPTFTRSIAAGLVSSDGAPSVQAHPPRTNHPAHCALHSALMKSARLTTRGVSPLLERLKSRSGLERCCGKVSQVHLGLHACPSSIPPSQGMLTGGVWLVW